MSGLPLMKDAFANGGPSSAAGAATDRAAAGHRRPSADGNAFAEIVSSLGPAQPRPAPRSAGAPANATATADRHPGTGGQPPSFDLAAGAAEGAPGAGSASDVTSTLESMSSPGDTPARQAPSALRAAAALFHGAVPDGDAGFGTTLTGTTAPARDGHAHSIAAPSDPGAALARAANSHHDPEVGLALPLRLPPSVARDERAPAPTGDTSGRDATLAARTEAPSGEETSAGVETARADRPDAVAEPAPRLDTIALPPSAAPTTVQDGMRAADAVIPASPRLGPTDAGRAVPAAVGTRPSVADAPTPVETPAAMLPGTTPADTPAPLAHLERAPDPKVPQDASLPRPATPVSAQGAGSAATPLETGAAPPAFPATTAATPVGSASAADAPAQASGAGGGRVTTQVRDMRTHFAPVVPRTIAVAVGGKPEAAASAGAAPAAMEAAAPTVDAEVARAVTAPPAAPAPSTAQAAVAAASSPTVIGAPGADESGGPPPATARAAAEGVRGSGPREAAPPVATAPDQRVTQRQESAAVRRADVSEATSEAPAVADTAPVAASSDGAAPTTSAGSPTDLPLRTLAQEIGRVARPIAADGGSPLATTTAGQPNALRRDVEVELSAPEFGVVRVRMRLNGSSLELRLRTDDPATLMLLAERRTELERAISEVGVDAKVVDVSRTATPASATSPTSPGGQAPASDGGAGGDGQQFEQRPSPDRNDRRAPFDRQTDGSTPDEDPTSRAGTRPGTLFV